MTAVVGFVAAGGASRRMGEDKAGLPWEGGTLLDHAVARLRALTPDVRILCGPSPRYAETGLPLVLDARPNLGPLAGLAAALEAIADGDSALLLAVDLPLVTVELLRRLIDASPGWDAVVPRSRGGREPLCGLYRRSCGAAVTRCLGRSDLKMTSFWPDVRVLELDAVPAPGADEEGLFANVNTPEDYSGLRGR